jgi:exosortase/archaeosortase family protein
VAWSLGLFGLLRLGWVETHALLPLTRLQGRLAVGLCGTPTSPIDVTLACSGADALALCVGAILAYPAGWRMRLAGAAGGLTLVLGLNTLRIGTLGRAAASPAWFETLHLYVWPAVLTLAIAGYVFGWMRFADGRQGGGRRGRESVTRDASPVTVSPRARITPRFMALAAAFLLLFTAASPLYLESAGVLAVGAFIARLAAAALHLFGVEARAAANVLWTSRGGFAVTQECISTPLIPIYLAAVVAYASTWRQRSLGLVAAAPLFVGLGIARLLVVALPAALVASPLYLIHAFYQLLLAAVVVALAAFWRHGAGGTAWRRALMGMTLGAAVAYLLGAPYANVLARAADTIGAGASSGFVADAPLDDPQGAITLLPAFQVGLYLALWIAAFAAAGWRRLLTGLALLGLVQVATLVAFVLASHAGFAPHVRDVRAWAVVGPLLVVLAVVSLDWRRRRPTPVTAAAGSGAGG